MFNSNNIKTIPLKILNSKSKTIFSAAFVLTLASLISKILGVLRDRLLAGRFGAGDELDIYYAAFRIPDLLFTLIVMGAISSGFIPVFAQYFYKDRKEAWNLASNILNIILLTLVIAAGFLMLFAPQIIQVIAPGFEGEKREFTILLTRIMFLSPIILGISSILSSILQYFHRFLAYSLAPIMYNVGIIIGILIFVPILGLVGLGWGVVLGAFLHMLVQLPSAIYSGFRWKLIFNLRHQGLVKIWRLMIPRTIGLAGNQINFVVITAIASTLSAGSISIFNLANNLQYVPIGIFGVAFAVAIFPVLSKSFAEKNKKSFSNSFSTTFSQLLFLVVPLSALFFILRAHLVRIVLGTGRFDWIDTRLTAAALGLFAVSIFAQSLIPLISRAFYAFHNTKTPVLVSLFCIGINIILSFFFVWVLKNQTCFTELFSKALKVSDIDDISILGLPLAFSIASIINFFVLLKLFSLKIGWWKLKEIINSFLKVFLSTFLMIFLVYNLLYILNLFLDTHTFFGIFIQATVSGLLGFIFYFLFMLILGFKQAKRLFEKLKKIIGLSVFNGTNKINGSK